MPDDVRPPDVTRRFTSRADAYDAGRPSYPAAAIDAILDGCKTATPTVADLGAGTGISARSLAARGATVFAVEPNAAMCARAEAAPSIVWLDARAEDTGLSPASVDIVTAFQAFHWFEPEATIREIARILRPGGRAAVVYNERDARDPFTAAYGELVRRFATDATESRRAGARTRFRGDRTWRDVRDETVAHRQRLERVGLHARALSTSYLPSDGPTGAELHEEIDALFDVYANDGTIDLLLETTVTIATSSR